MNVYVFKTSLKKRDVKFIKLLLDKCLINAKWNIDFNDCDRILRIESQEDVSDLVRESMSKSGFLCSEL